MERLIYKKNIDKALLKENNIVVEDGCFVEDGVILNSGVCIVGKSQIEAGCEIFGYSVIANAKIGKNCKIKSSFIEDSTLADECEVGPFAHVRKNCEIGENVRVGNFVEIKNSQIGKNTKMAHLAYVGDAEIGNNCNIGCGVVFCNYNGKEKNKCCVGDYVFIGSNSNLIAPVTISDNAYIAAGSTINVDVDVDELAIARAKQVNKKNFINPYVDREI